MKEEIKEKDAIVENDDKQVLIELKTAITEDVMKELEKRQPNRKAIFGGGDNGEEKALTEQKEVAAEYFQKLGRRESTKALSNGASGNGVELVPTYVSDKFIGVAQKYGLVRRKATKWPMQGINENVPTISALAAYRLAADTTKITSNQPTTGAVALAAKRVGVIVPVSKVLLQNSTVNLVDAIVSLAAKATAKLEDKWGLLGLASGEGIFQTTGVPSVTLASGATTYDKLTPENLLDMLDVIDENFYGENMSWAMSLSMLNILRRIRAAVGSDKQGFLVQGVAGMSPNTLWDIPYDLNAVMPKKADGSQAGKAFMALVDWDNVLFGDRMQYTVELSDQATITDTDGSTLINLFEQEMVAIKISGQIEIKVTNPTLAHAKIITAAS